MKTKIAKYGNSLTVRLPGALVRTMDLHAGDIVTLRQVASGLFLEAPPLTRLQARLATVKGIEAELGTGPAVGAEIVE